MDIEEYSKYSQLYTQEVPELFLKHITSFHWNSFLDLGCGDGSTLYALNKRGLLKNKKVYAVDLSQKRIDLAKRINEHFICMVADACKVDDIEDNGIDLLFSSMLIEHVENDEAMVKEIHRLLKSGGTAFISTVFKKWYGWYFYRCNGKWVIDPTHLREYTNDSQLLDLFRRHGFEILEQKKILIRRPIVDFILKRLHVDKNTFIKYPFLERLRVLSIPILGYYDWEIICRKK